MSGWSNGCSWKTGEFRLSLSIKLVVIITRQFDSKFDLFLSPEAFRKTIFKIQLLYFLPFFQGEDGVPGGPGAPGSPGQAGISPPVTIDSVGGGGGSYGGVITFVPFFMY